MENKSIYPEMLKALKWFDIIALSIYLNNKTKVYKVKEIEDLPFFKQCALYKKNNNLNAKIWQVIEEYTVPNNERITTKRKITKKFQNEEHLIFDTQNIGEWFLTESGIKFIETEYEYVINKIILKDIIKEKEEYSIQTLESTYGKIDDDYIPKTEGQRKVIQSIRYERNTQNRIKALEYHGTTCLACEFSFNNHYGENLARNFIEVHHIKPVSEGEAEINPETDLVPLCSNCHSMIHRENPMPQNISEIKNRYIKGV